MKKTVTLLSLLGFITLLAVAQSDYKTEEREPLQHTFSGDRTLDVDEINGSIDVIGDSGNTIRVEGEKIMRAADQQGIAQAKSEVTLDMNEKDGVAQLYENGPFRNSGRSSADHGFHDHSDREYSVSYNLTIHLPRATELRLHTINGSVTTQNTTGKFDVYSVNGTLKMTAVAGSGSTGTVNGSTTVSFSKNPTTDCHFKALNGRMDVSFQPDLSANIQVKTLNGQAFTDFESTMLLPSTALADQQSGRRVYRSDRGANFRIGSGGPELTFETLNGNIYIRRQAR